MFELAAGYARDGMPACVRLDEVSAGYFDLVAQTISGGDCSTLALVGSAEQL